MYSPFGQSEYGCQLLAGFLKADVGDRVETVDTVDFDNEETGDLSPPILPGEYGGSPGIGQASPDLGQLCIRHPEHVEG